MRQTDKQIPFYQCSLQNDLHKNDLKHSKVSHLTAKKECNKYMMHDGMKEKSDV